MKILFGIMIMLTMLSLLFILAILCATSSMLVLYFITKKEIFKKYSIYLGNTLKYAFKDPESL
jgi:hypothetical protein